MSQTPTRRTKPEFARRASGLPAPVSFTLLVGMPAAVLIGLIAGGPTFGFIGFVVIVFALMVFAVRSQRRFLELAGRRENQDYRVCLGCGYDLPLTSECPECGFDTSGIDLRASWRDHGFPPTRGSLGRRFSSEMLQRNHDRRRRAAETRRNQAK